MIGKLERIKLLLYMSNRPNENDPAAQEAVHTYAQEIIDRLIRRKKCEGREPETLDELNNWMLDGASDWFAYSNSGKALVEAGDLAKRLELSEDGDYNGLLVVQGFALDSASKWIVSGWRAIKAQEEGRSSATGAEAGNAESVNTDR